MSKFIGSQLAVAAFLVAGAFANGVTAKTVPIPADDPIATLTAPDAWEPSAFDTGVEMTSPDGGIYLSVEEVKADDLTSAVADTVQTLGKQGLVVDTSTKKASDFENNGMKFHDFAYKGTDKDGPTNFDVTLVETKTPGTFVMLAFWGSDDADKANSKTLTDILQSIQLTK